ncbi:hypothetical protein DQ403_13155 [Stutzerimonas zhaodongensis]|uniref:Uncharacterized protein n=1 Tax=Stutzerimonas zhaodongensis TaxID=1176257 RepID=A0A365PT41_9GAMM|nr:hypothetical protein DQ403_13155 [Stutzerimonas zhaodongensis]
MPAKPWPFAAMGRSYSRARVGGCANGRALLSCDGQDKPWTNAEACGLGNQINAGWGDKAVVMP